jgi:hypothetical protein
VDALGGTLSANAAPSSITSASTRRFGRTRRSGPRPFADVVLNPTFPADESAKPKTHQSQLRLQRGQHRLLQRSLARSYGDHPAARFSLSPAIRSFDTEVLRVKFHSTYYKLNNAILQSPAT